MDFQRFEAETTNDRHDISHRYFHFVALADVFFSPAMIFTDGKVKEKEEKTERKGGEKTKRKG